MRTRALLALAAAALTLPAVRASSAAGAEPAVERAVAFLVSQQRADGGFGQGEAGFPGFETPDVLLALGAAAQTSSTWDPAAARAAVDAVTTSGNSGLRYLDDWADGAFGAIGAGGAARVTIVAGALGIDPRTFDPDGDGATDLVATVEAGRQADGTWGAGLLNTTLTAVVALRVAGRPIGADTVAAIEAAQQANGSWNYQGDPSATDADPDSTGLAVEALVAAGRDPSDPAIGRALAFLASAQSANGTWSDAYAQQENPNSTALGALGVVAAGYDVSSRCWRDLFAPARRAEGYTTPSDALLATQQSDGRFASPNDSFGVNTSATAQGLQAVVTGFQPVARAEPQPCTPAPPATTTTTSAITTTTVSGQGSTSTDAPTVPASTSTSAGPAALPNTGSDSLRATAVAVALLVAGAALAGAGRRRAASPRARTRT